MKTLLLLRHAKSSWDDPSLSDHDRPLSERGRDAAPRMARWILDQGLVPERVLCSTAERARDTWALMAEVLGEPEVEHRRELYHAGPADLLGAVRAEDDAVERLLVVGHNPTMEALARALAGRGGEKEVERMRRKFPTAGLAVLEFPAREWLDLAPGLGTLRHFVRPADLADADDPGS